MLVLREADVRSVLTMADAVHCLEDAALRQASGDARYRPRSRLRFQGGSLNVLPGADLELGVAGLKTYMAVGGTARFAILLFDVAGGELLAMIEADLLGMIRTGAASGVATRHMSGRGPHALAVVGTGWQARGQVEAVLSVCDVEHVRAFGRDPQRRAAFADWVRDELGVPCTAAATVHEAVAGATIVCTATNASTPVLTAGDVDDGAHINAVGSNSLLRRELDEELTLRARTVVVDSRAQAELECGDLLPALQRGALDLSALPELHDVVAGRVRARNGDADVTIFESHGLGVQDVVVAEHVYRRARAEGLGHDLPFAALSS